MTGRPLRLRVRKGCAERDREMADLVNALTLHKARIRRLQEALCECAHRDFFQAGLHDEVCPVFQVTREEREGAA